MGKRILSYGGKSVYRRDMTCVYVGSWVCVRRGGSRNFERGPGAPIMKS